MRAIFREYEKFAFVLVDQPDQGIDQSGLPGPVLANQAYYLIPLYKETDPVYYVVNPVVGYFEIIQD